LRAIANLEADMGRRGEAARRMSGVADELAALIRHDPANADWQRELTGIRTELSQIQARRH
jgi:hypothetical protein